jgi:hypothetical protein
VRDKPEVDDEVFAVVERVAFDSAIGFNLDVVEALLTLGGEGQVREVRDIVGLPLTSVNNHLADLEALDIVTKKRSRLGERGQPPLVWSVAAEVVSLWQEAGVRGGHARRAAASRRRHKRPRKGCAVRLRKGGPRRD